MIANYRRLSFRLDYDVCIGESSWLESKLHLYILTLSKVYVKYDNVYVNHITIFQLYNYMEGSGSATKNEAAYHKHQKEEETPPNRNHNIMSNR